MPPENPNTIFFIITVLDSNNEENLSCSHSIWSLEETSVFLCINSCTLDNFSRSFSCINTTSLAKLITWDDRMAMMPVIAANTISKQNIIERILPAPHLSNLLHSGNNNIDKRAANTMGINTIFAKYRMVKNRTENNKSDVAL